MEYEPLRNGFTARGAEVAMPFRCLKKKGPREHPVILHLQPVNLTMPSNQY
jgi:hypothetical protein